ncbi:phosphatidylserine decarboxylase-domain-containing protein [Mycena pura]|uniref:Phosphatidylserine decarboxylase-domain-containing protein n=1 Tax=Mycena pura TaxID=153505 RepID=A0AAD6VUV2_9AGAR|nr:phosphatidylserine decarboxylase-domain-containing protein [Mycena pura]
MDVVAVVHPTDYASFPILPEIEELKKFIKSDTELYMMFNQMFTDDNGLPLAPHVPNYETMFEIINKWLQESPTYLEIDNSPTLILTHAMNTHAGFSAFLNKELNRYFKRLFDRWGVYLTTPASANVLNAGKGGWFSKPALAALMEYFPGLIFEEVFVSDPTAEHYGFTCWDSFFARHLRPGIRPVDAPENPNIISAACESQCYNIATNVQERDSFWLKGQSYSLRDMLAHSAYVPQFVGGTVYQGYLRVTGYHRWHAPAAGVIEKIVPVPGAYFCQSPAMLDSPISMEAPFDTRPIFNSLPFFAMVNARLLMFIEADNPRIGLYCFIAIGMQEISTAEPTVKEGQHVERGEELGTFHFGGSTDVLVLRPETNVQFLIKPGDAVKVRGALGKVLCAAS